MNVTIWLLECGSCGGMFAAADTDTAIIRNGEWVENDCEPCREKKRVRTTISVLDRECLACGSTVTATTAPATAPRRKLLVFDCPACLPVERFELVESEQPAVTR